MEPLWTSQANNYSPNRKCPSDRPPPESSWVCDSPPFSSLQPQLRESVLQWVPKTRVSAPPPTTGEQLLLAQLQTLIQLGGLYQLRGSTCQCLSFAVCLRDWSLFSGRGRLHMGKGANQVLPFPKKKKRGGGLKGGGRNLLT